MYPYHNKIKSRIANGELVGHEYVTHARIGECLMLYFNTAPYQRPIRPHRYEEYKTILWDQYRQSGSKGLESIQSDN